MSQKEMEKLKKESKQVFISIYFSSEEEKDQFREIACLWRTSLNKTMMKLALTGIETRKDELEKLRAKRKR